MHVTSGAVHMDGAEQTRWLLECKRQYKYCLKSCSLLHFSCTEQHPVCTHANCPLDRIRCFHYVSRNTACNTLCVHAFAGAAQIDEAEEDQMASASPQQPDLRESAAAEADEEGSDTEPTQVIRRKLDPTLE